MLYIGAIWNKENQHAAETSYYILTVYEYVTYIIYIWNGLKISESMK